MKARFGSEKGVALLVVLWLLMLLSVVVGEFCSNTRTEVNVTRNLRETTQAYYIAKAGINRAIVELEAKRPLTETEGPRLGGKSERAVETRANPQMPATSFGEGRYEVTIWNESGKVNINRAGSLLLKMTLNGFDLADHQKEVIVDSILDWRDRDDLHRPEGAENDYYLSLTKPYRCKNDDFESIDELLLVRGVTPAIFFGGLKDLVTVYPHGDSSESNNYTGPGKKMVDFNFNTLNINAAPYAMIRSLPRMTDDLAKRVMEYRSQQDFKSLSDFLSIVGPEVYAGMASHLTLETLPFYTIQSRGSVEGTRVRHVLQALVEIDGKLRDRYRIISWSDDLGDIKEPYQQSGKQDRG
jgi:general secretion pathway protein K